MELFSVWKPPVSTFIKPVLRLSEATFKDTGTINLTCFKSTFKQKSS